MGSAAQARRLEKLSRLYAVLSKVNEAIVRAPDADTLYLDVCRIVAADGQFPLVWIGIVEGRTVKPVAAAGEESDYVRGLRVETHGKFGRGPSGTCIREGRPVVNDDFDANPLTRPWREAALAHGLRASASFPLRCQEKMSGSLTLYAREPGRFDAEEVRLLEALSADVAYALDKMSKERALEESERSLREADQRKNDFLAVLSHELRNPLAPIRHGLYVLERAVPGSEAARHAIEIIARQSSQLTRLVDDLLDVTRIARNKIELHPAPLDLNDVVRRTIEDHRALFEQGGVGLEAELAAQPLPLDGDDERLSQVIGNLLQNAAKFTPRGGRVTVRTAAGEDGSCAVLSVADTGVGIEPAMLSRLFQPFMQADATLDRSKGGLGLGLALVKSLVKMHGGEVRALSDGPGKGTEFVVELPLGAPVSAPPKTGVSARPRTARRVLVIEDNVDAAECLRCLLEFAGHDASVAHNGADGLTLARSSPPDVVLCDIGLPGMDGYEVARAFRADPALGATALVALSGYAQPEDLQRAVEAGFTRHLAKPASPDVLERLLGELPDRRPDAGPCLP